MEHLFPNPYLTEMSAVGYLKQGNVISGIIARTASTRYSRTTSGILCLNTDTGSLITDQSTLTVCYFFPVYKFLQAVLKK